MSTRVILRSKKASQVRVTVAVLFALALVLSAIATTLAVVSGIRGASPATLFPPDTSPAVRLLVFVIGMGLSWFAGKMLYKHLLRGEVPVGESIGIAYVLLFYLLLLFAAATFLGVLYWFLFPFLFFVLLVVSTIAVWGVLGRLLTIAALASMLVAAAITYYLVS